MSNPYFNFTVPFIPGNKVRSGPVNTQFSALQAAFDLLPASPTAPTHGTTTFAVESGSLNAYAVAMPNTRISNTEGDEVVFKATHDCSGPSTLAVDAIPAVPLRRFDGTPVQTGDILTGKYYAVRFDSANTQFVIVYPILITVTGGITYANPTAQVGLTAVNGVAATVMRSDAAPTLNVGIAPTWSATHTFSLTPVVPNSSWTYAKIQNVSATSRILGRVTAGAGVIEELTGAQAAGLIPSATLTYAQIQNVSATSRILGRATAGAGVIEELTGTQAAALIPAAAITYSQIQNVSATSRFHGRITAGAGVLEELTGTQATTLLDAFTTGLKGLVPASGGGTTNFLRADGSFAVPSTLAITGTTALNIAALTVGQSAIVVKTASTSRASTTTLAIDPDLRFTNMPTGTYVVDAAISFTDGGGGARYQMKANAGAAVPTPITGYSQLQDTTTVQDISSNAATMTTAGFVNIQGTVVSPTGNDYEISWAQKTSNGANTTLNTGSYIRLTRIS